jgi:hypothetical protein
MVFHVPRVQLEEQPAVARDPIVTIAMRVFGKTVRSE